MLKLLMALYLNQSGTVVTVLGINITLPLHQESHYFHTAMGTREMQSSPVRVRKIIGKWQSSISQCTIVHLIMNN